MSQCLILHVSHALAVMSAAVVAVFSVKQVLRQEK
jgi:hypothetical protein